MEFQEFKQAVAEQCCAQGIADYELYYVESESTSVSVFQHEIKIFSSSTDGGVCFRCIVNGKMGYASTEELSTAQAASIVARAADNASVLEAEEPVFLGEGGQVYETLKELPHQEPTVEELIAKVLSTQEALYASSPMVVDGCETQGVMEKSRVAICNSRGLDLEDANALTALIVSTVVSDGKEMSDSYEIKLGDLDKIDSEKLCRKVTDDAIRKMGGDVAPTGQYPVVFAPDAVCDLLSTFSCIFSSEMVQKGMSKLRDMEGQVIASPAVTLVDDPFCEASPGRSAFDSEGSPTYKKNIIEQGRLSTLLYNLKTAAVAGKKTTGNGSKGGYNAPMGIDTFTLYLAPGETTEEELLKKAGSGVCITALGGLHAGANPITGDFSLQSSGFLIENGIKTTPVKSFTVAGNFYDLLKQITAVASNLEYPGLASFGSPSILVEGLSVAGK